MEAPCCYLADTYISSDSWFVYIGVRYATAILAVQLAYDVFNANTE